MKIYYWEEEGETFIEPPHTGRFARKEGKIKEPITIKLHVVIDKEKYNKIKAKYKTSLSDRIFSYFGF